MAKLKSIEQLADDAKKGDLIRVVFNDYDVVKGFTIKNDEITGYYQGEMSSPLAEDLLVVELTIKPFMFPADYFGYSRTGRNDKIRGYKILRRAKK